MPMPVLLQAGLPALIKGLAGALKNVNTPVAQGASSALDALSGSFATGEMSDTQLAEINRHLEKMEEFETGERAVAIQQINESLRTEVASNDPYVRRMRPTFGYIIALTWAAQMLAIAYVIVFDTQEAALVIEAVQSLSTIWAVGLSVLGIYVYRRSSEKQNFTSAPAPSPKPVTAPIRPPHYNP
ncbi:MAG: 3TM-type holin [Pseudobdellovibrionaceae bacterium]